MYNWIFFFFLLQNQNQPDLYLASTQREEHQKKESKKII